MERKPDFNQLLKVIGRSAPDRPVLFDFFIGDRIVEQLASKSVDRLSAAEKLAVQMDAFMKAGYDYLTIKLDGFSFVQDRRETAQSARMTGGGAIAGREDYERYPWPRTENLDISVLDMDWCGQDYEGARLIVYGPGGILENVTDILGYDSLCFMLYDQEELVRDLFEKVGGLLYGYYSRVVGHPNVGAVIYNDDWGYKTQTILSPACLRELVFPWVQRIVELAHSHNKPVILHSCGNLDAVMDDVIGMGMDAKHSFEDAILPVEQAYERYGDRISILGGMDVDFMCRSAPREIEARCRRILEQTRRKGGYALGTGNSVPDYIPFDHYLAMLSAAGAARLDNNITGGESDETCL